MSDKSSDYRYPATALVVIGGLATLAGFFMLFVGPGFTFLLWLLGIPLLVIGLVRESRSRKTLR